MSRALLAALAAALQLAAASAPCPPGGDGARHPASARFPAAALHATHADDARGERALELRAPCPCGCRHAAASGVANARLEPALLRGAPAFVRPWVTTPVEPDAPTPTEAPAATPDPVPRAA